MQKLTVKQQKFADEYIISGNATQAALKAGYAERSARSVGNENLTKPDIKAYIDAQLKKLHDEKVDSQEQIMEFLSSVRRGEVTESVATAKGVYDNVPVAARDRIKAAELIGKRYAMWTDKQDLTATINPVQITDNVPAGSDDDG
ncbi:Terminase Small Subunit [Levilactobacillus brevis KB290]|uniref:Terminase Small Subunit n=1 Tax=Levilactobacillus brevis KB290 TaxID=1001583 RepID=M5AHG8_LEVBR|nr:terminase small subunit [Levilactobacillus brevis]BAN07792.1 Terminase Small Subunit [Levilactobacillus brevis KB290]